MKMTWHSARLLLYLEPMVRKHTCMRTTSMAVMVIFLESGILKVTRAMFKVSSQQYEAHRQLHFERYPTVPYFTDMD